jgi:hypothetical protein
MLLDFFFSHPHDTMLPFPLIFQITTQIPNPSPNSLSHMPTPHNSCNTHIHTRHVRHIIPPSQYIYIHIYTSIQRRCSISPSCTLIILHSKHPIGSSVLCCILQGVKHSTFVSHNSHYTDHSILGFSNIVSPSPAGDEPCLQGLDLKNSWSANLLN